MGQGHPRGEHQGGLIRSPWSAQRPRLSAERRSGHDKNGQKSRMSANVRFSNRPFGVKHFQTIRRCSVDVTHGLVLLFGIGTKALVWGFFSQEV